MDKLKSDMMTAIFDAVDNFDELHIKYIQGDKLRVLLDRATSLGKRINDINGTRMKLLETGDNNYTILFSDDYEIPRDCSALFSHLSKVTEVDISDMKCRGVKSVNAMFRGSWNLRRIKLPIEFDTSCVKDFSCMFEQCFRLERIDNFEFNTERSENFSYMFERCKSLSEIDLSCIKTDRCKDIRYMFSECNSLNTLDISHFRFNNIERINSLIDMGETLRVIKMGVLDLDALGKIRGCLITTCKSIKKIEVDRIIGNNVNYLIKIIENCADNLEIHYKYIENKDIIREEIVGYRGVKFIEI